MQAAMMRNTGSFGMNRLSDILLIRNHVKWKFSIINFVYFEVFGYFTKIHGCIKNWWVEGQIQLWSNTSIDKFYIHE